MNRVRIGVSACLLGQKVRYDGQHKRDPFLVDQLGAFVDWVSVCPEVEVGMGVPREPVRLLARRGDGPRMVGVQSGADWTARMNRFADARAKALAKEDLAGFVLKAKSPSCGMERVKVYADDQATTAHARGAGLFAAALARTLPNLPVEDEERLADADLRDNFLERVCAYARLRALWQSRWQSRWIVGALVSFHTAHKMQLLAHTTDGYRALGRLVAAAKKSPRGALREDYEAAFMAALKKPASPGRHANVLMHLLGHLKTTLDAGDKQALLAVIEEARRGRVPVVAAMTMLAHHAQRSKAAYLLGQTYLTQRIDELRLVAAGP